MLSLIHEKQSIAKLIQNFDLMEKREGIHDIKAVRAGEFGMTAWNRYKGP